MAILNYVKYEAFFWSQL